MSVGQDEFRAEMARAGLNYSGPIIADGQYPPRRFRAEGQNGRDSWYILYPGPPMSGVFGCWQGTKGTWFEKQQQECSPAEWNSMIRGIHKAKQQGERAEQERHAKARNVAAWLLGRATPATATHPYLTRKGLGAHGQLRLYRGALVLPLRDSAGALQTLQFIAADGQKRFLSGGKCAGAYFTLSDKAEGPLVVCEGVSTGTSILEATGYAVVCAMSVGNLLAVAQALKSKWPQREIIVCADNDQWTKGNPGLSKATEAAKAIRAHLVVPDFTGLDASGKPTDFNDLARLAGLKKVRDQIESATVPKETPEEVVERLALLRPIEYDRVRQSEAETLGIRIFTLDAEVLARRRKPEMRDSAQTMPLEPWPEPVEGAELLAEIRPTYNRFLGLPSYADVLLSVLTLNSYAFECFTFTPYLHVTSPEPQCGKSTLAELMSYLCNKATTPGGMSAAAMFRRIDREKPTLLLDEWDTLKEDHREAALNVLNTGFKSNGVYTICVGDDHEDKDFHTFCPKAIFGLAAAKLPEATRSRCFCLVLQRKPKGHKVEKLRKFDGRELRRKCLRWAKDNRERLASIIPSLPEGLSARQEDISEPLLAIAEICGAEWPGLVRDCLSHFCGAAEGEEGSTNTELLRDIYALLNTPAYSRQSLIGSDELKQGLNSEKEWQWAAWNNEKGITQKQLTSRLRSYGIQTRNTKLNGKTVKRYHPAQFHDAFALYLPDIYPLPATMPVNTERNEDFEPANANDGSGSKNASSTNKDGSGSGLRIERPEIAANAEPEPLLAL